MRIIVSLFLIFSSMTALAQQAVIKYENLPDNKDEIKMPKFRPVSIQENFYNEYKFSKHKEKKLEEKIKVIYDLDKAQKCKRIGQIHTPARVLANFVSDKSKCEISIKTLMDYADKKGANTLYISILPMDCQLGKFQSFAMNCSLPEDME